MRIKLDFWLLEIKRTSLKKVASRDTSTYVHTYIDRFIHKCMGFLHEPSIDINSTYVAIKA